MFEDFDFRLLNDPGFKEDAVREELVVPILNRLGYTASGEHRIVRSKPLVHPFVSIGTKQYKVNIIPDYLLSVGGSTKWVLDAKGPGEEILTGKNVEQAYSYAIHKDVRVSLYGLCNGHTLSVFHISHVEPVLSVPLTEVNARWDEVNRVLCPMAFIDPERLDFFPDFGLTMLKLGGAKFENIFFPWVPANYIGKVADDLYTLTSTFDLNGDYCATFDLDTAMYQKLLAGLLDKDRQRTLVALSRQPYHIVFDDRIGFDDRPTLAINATLSDTVTYNDKEEFLPLKIINIERSKFSAQDMLQEFPYEN